MVRNIHFTSFVFPFILRGVKLIGIDSVEYDMQKRLVLWNKIADEFELNGLSDLTT